MNTLQIANGYCGSRLYEELFQRLRSNGNRLGIFVPVANGTNILQSEQVDVKIVPCFCQMDRVLFYQKQKKMIAAMEAEWNISQFDLIHAHTVFSGGYAAHKFFQKYGKPYIVAVRNTDKNVFLRYMIHMRRIGVKIMRDAAAVIFLSPAYRDSVIETYVPGPYREELYQKSLVIPNGISDIFVQDCCQPHTLPETGERRLLYVGELSDNKNISTTIQAVEQLRKDGLNVTLTVAGAVKQGKYQGYLEKFPFVTYLGKIPPEQVKAVMRQCDLFVMPSHLETFGLVYAEAMSQGLPVLYTKGQGFDGQFPNGMVGYTVDDHAPQDVSDKIKAALEHYDDLARNAYENATQFSWDRIARQYCDLYEKIVRH